MSRLGKRLIAAVKEGRAIARGEAREGSYRIHMSSQVDVAKIRRQLGMSQAVFSQRFGFNAASVKDWEQGRSAPSGPVCAYLKVIEKDPRAVERALAS